MAQLAVIIMTKLKCRLSVSALRDLGEQIDPLEDDGNYGIDTCNETVHTVETL